MEIREVQNKETWENFLLECKEKTFLQSWNWGEFQKMMGSNVWRLGAYDKDELVSVAMVVKTAAKRATFLLAPHAPSLVPTAEGGLAIKYEALKAFLGQLRVMARKEKASFIRISPIWENSAENSELFRKLGFKKAPIHAHPEASWKLDIRYSEEELLKNMRKTTRYLLRQALKNQDLKVYQSDKIESLDVFNKLNQEVAKRQRFVPFSYEYLKNEFLAFQPDNQISLFFAKYKEEVVASAFVLFWSGFGFYHHAASLPQYSKISAPYLLQWEAIKEAKKRGCFLYDFWGYVNPQEQPRHPWAGPTLFKMGFGGMAHQYVKTQDFPLSKKYWLTYIFEKLRKTKRGL